MLVSLLLFGFLLGLKHALDADHIAAMASLATRSPGIRSTLRLAGAWGVGHASILVLFGTVLVLLGATLPDQVARWLEAAVGVMLVLLGLGVLRRVRGKEIHAHAHEHDGDVTHAHLHIHEEGRPGHRHGHAGALVPKALLIGCVHGLAGTAGLVLLAVPTMESGGRALAYLVVFGAGTVLGMLLFSLLISVPLTMSVRRLRWMAGALEVVVGAANVLLGVWITVQSLA
jgi:cytochrome c biogenesis protein CcdA